MDPTDLDQLTAVADRRAAAAHVASTQLRKVADDFMAVATGYVGFRHAADALDAMGEADRALAAIFRRLALTARRDTLPEPAPEPAPVRREDEQDWRSWTDDDFPDDEDDIAPVVSPRRTNGARIDPAAGPVDDDWDDEAPLVADVRLGVPPSGSDG